MKHTQRYIYLFDNSVLKHGLSVCLAIFMLWLFVGGCSSISSLERAEKSSIKKTFADFAKGIETGDLKKVYGLMSTAYKSNYTYDNFAQWYEKNKKDLLLDFQETFVLDLGIVERKATLRVKFGTGYENWVELTKEEAGWKWNDMGNKKIRSQ